MSANYAAGLSPCDSRGVCGLPEVRDTSEEAAAKTKQLADLMAAAKHCVLVVGAGISTAAGIPDFRGPNGIWTIEERQRKAAKKLKSCGSVAKKKVKREAKGESEAGEEQTDSLGKQETNVKQENESPQVSECSQTQVSLDTVKPTLTHLVIKSLVEKGLVHYIISQNIDGLFLKTGIERRFLSEVHGDFFVDECNVCLSRYIRKTASPTMALKVSERACPRPGRPCRGRLRDTILDWEDELPESGQSVRRERWI